MAYIIISTTLDTCLCEKAAKHLRSLGHRVDITPDANELLRLFEIEQPDVLLFGFLLRGMTSYQVREELHDRYPDMSTQLVWMVSNNKNSSSPGYSWDWTDISTFLIAPYTEWHIILIIEQLLYRTVLK